MKTLKNEKKKLNKNDYEKNGTQSKKHTDTHAHENL